MRAILGLWRWRHNPLCRDTDRVEGWIALLVLVVITVAAPLTGAVAGSLCHQALLDVVDRQRSERALVTAVVLRIVEHNTDVDLETGPAGSPRYRVAAKWPTPDGSSRTGTVPSTLRSPEPGDRFRLWTDRHGTPVERPMNRASAATHSVLAGFGAALAAVGAAEGVRRLVMWRLIRRRYDLWDQAWDKAGPDWGRTGTGS
ncbi:hypothetical protein HUT18_01190 [Streptomyces sp. NA04227]|uniref:Rv1733c family protein n=1 Tax=Streptomyces sp. NA04227 TaxID=2742136 RepID=UPI00159067C4|nr:hypothetical protein [Streptomyces sp. NA04227]QKW05178.1 hypothetical protein HUT18_01190 [Streptomyces sp. NA04227]